MDVLLLICCWVGLWNKRIRLSFAQDFVPNNILADEAWTCYAPAPMPSY